MTAKETLELHSRMKGSLAVTMITPTKGEKIEAARCRQSLESSGMEPHANAVGILATLPDGHAMHVSVYDRAMKIYRHWLCFGIDSSTPFPAN